MNILRLLLLVVSAYIFMPAATGQGLKAFKLKNGVSVYVWEDNTKPDVFGMVSFKVGSVNDPDNLTGLAHYLEHVMFKGTQKIGTLDWAKEGPLYEKIIAKYDEMAAEADPEKKKAIGQEINDLTREAAQYSVGNEFSTLVDHLGGKRLNAGTGLEQTVYYNSFPATQVEKWLDLYSERLINPVFRTFQTELETVYEEYNMYNDNLNSRLNEFLSAQFFAGHPYARPIIGKPEHLKNPQLSQLIEFYNTWYIPSNMALILVGNVNTNEILPLIQQKFGRLQAKEGPTRKTYPQNEYKGRSEVTTKMYYYPMLVLSYNGVPAGHADEIALDICTSILSNSQRTGLLDKLSIDGDLMGVGSYVNMYKENGKVIIQAVPSYDPNQRRWESHKSVEKMILKEIEKLQSGDVPDWLIQSIKTSLARDFDLGMESNEYKAYMLTDAFVNNRDLNDVLNYKDRVMTITPEQIKAVAKKYFTSDCMVVYVQQGKPKNEGKIEKPEYKAIEPVAGQKSEYAQAFELIPAKEPKIEFCDFNAVKQAKINDRSKLFYNRNNENEVFTLTLKYGVGTAKMPKLAYAVELMENAGIMAMLKPHEFKQEMSKLNATCNYNVDDNYLYIEMRGYENQLKDACLLLTRQILMPQLEEKQLQSIVGSAYESRRMEKERIEAQEAAVEDYMLYQDKSDYIDRLKLSDISALSISELTGEFQRATTYEAEVHYVGSLPFEEVYEVLSTSLPLKAGETASTSPEVKDRTNYTENTVFFLPNNEATQSKIYFYIDGKPFDKNDDLLYQAFSAYFGAGFGSLVLDEIREKRSMAYTSYGIMSTPPVPGKKTNFIGFIGTQGDKTIDAIDIYVNLLKDMPAKPERFSIVKQNIKESMMMNKPSFRYASQTYESWKRKGYTEDPAVSKAKAIENLTFEDIQKFYDQNIKGKSLTIGIVGNPKSFDPKALEKFGKVVRLNNSKVFSKE